jgi:LacI family transcriptional regulator
MFGLFIPDFANPVYAEIIKGAEIAAGNLGYALMTASSAGVRLGRAHYIDLLAQGRVDGMLFAGDESGNDLEQFRALRLPWVLVNRRIEGSRRYIILDDERGSRLAVEHLIALGHRRIAHIAGPETADTARRRRAGYASAMTSAGLPVDPRLIVHADYTPAGGTAAMSTLLAQPERPTAVLVANVASAVGALHAAYALGLSVPAEVSVIAIHDMPLASHLVPALTTVRMPLSELGRRAIELLATREPEDDITEIVTEPVDVIVRESTAPLK